MSVDLKNIYESGNPTALHELLEYCEVHGLTPPNWAKTEIQRILKMHFLGKLEVGRGRLAHKPKHFKSLMDDSIRRQAYTAVRRWQEDIRRFDNMPTRAIELWFNGKLDHSNKTKKYARYVTCQGLTGTDHHCTEEQLRKLVFKWKLPEKLSPQCHDHNDGAWMEMTDDERRNSHMLIGYWSSEIEYGMRKDDRQIFGANCETPQEINDLLKGYAKFEL